MIMRRTVVSAFATLLAAASLTLSAYAQSSTAFTYQGFLRDNGAPANGTYDLQFVLWDSLTGGSTVAGTVELNDVTVADGLFTVEIDFGTAPFNTGARRWIEIGVRPGDSTGGYNLLAPRIELTPVPYALYAQNVANNAVSADQLANDPNSLSKVSGGNMSIANGFLKKNRQAYFRATRFVTYGIVNQVYEKIAPSYPSEGWYAVRFSTDSIVSDNVNIQHNDGGVANQDSVGTVITVPVSGYYFIKFNARVYELGSYWRNASSGIQVKRPSDNAWQVIEKAESAIGGDVANLSSVSVSTVVYLPENTRIRAVAYGSPSGGAQQYMYGQPGFEIYLLSAADAPSN